MAACGSFEESLARFGELQRGEAGDSRINPACRSVLLQHGRQTAKAVVLMHGITSSPVQFSELGAQFFARGYNVLIARMPHHGYLNRLTREPGHLSVAEYQAYATETLDIGRGLGAQLTAVGLSVSGVLVAWCAQTRTDVDLAVPIAPAFGPHGVPPRLVPFVSRVGKLLPNLFVWWDFRERARAGPPCSYPGFSTHAMVESFRLGSDICRAAGTQPPACKQILVVTNPLDMAVNNAMTAAVVQRWRSFSATTVRTFEFGNELGRLHDIIGPYQPTARIDYVYPILLNLID